MRCARQPGCRPTARRKKPWAPFNIWCAFSATRRSCWRRRRPFPNTAPGRGRGPRHHRRGSRGRARACSTSPRRRRCWPPTASAWSKRASRASAPSSPRCAEEIGFPVALKILSPDITHKSDVGGVALDLGSIDELYAAVVAMLGRCRARRPDARIEGFTIQRMVKRSGAVELIVGLATDPTFGPVVLFGQGGTAVELIGDRAVALPPLNHKLAHELIARTRIARLLAGHRERPPVALDAVAQTLVRIAQLAADHGEIVELDVNPLLADPHGVLALDARMRVAPATASRRRALRDPALSEGAGRAPRARRRCKYCCGPSGPRIAPSTRPSSRAWMRRTCARASSTPSACCRRRSWRA